MEVGKLTVSLRTQTGKGGARRLRAAGLVPGICYGVKLDHPVNISLSAKALKGCLDPDKGHNTLIDLTIQGDEEHKQTITAMLREYQIDHIRREVTHVDLVAIDTDQMIEVDVVVALEGKFKGAVEGGQLHVVRHEVLVRCKPANIPAKLIMDITDLDIGDVRHISDLTFPEGVVSAVSPRLTIVTCVAPAAVEEVKVETADAAAAPDAATDKKADDKKAPDKGKGGDKK